MLTRQRLLRHVGAWPYLVVIACVTLANSVYLLGFARLEPVITRAGLASSVRPGPLAGQYTIDPNDGFTAQALGRAALTSLAHGHLPWWNHFEGLGSPLLGEMQAAASSPLLALMALPHGFLVYHVVLDLIAGLATVRLSRALGLRRSPSAIAGVLFALNGTLIWLLNASSAPVPFLPVLLLGVLRCVEGSRLGTLKGVLVVGTAVWLSVVQGFPEAAYLSGLMAAVLALYLGWTHREVARDFAIRLSAGLALGLALSAPALLAFASYVTKGADIGGHSGEYSKLGLPHEASGILAAPYAFGPIFAHTTPSALGVVWGNVGGYTSALVILLASAGLVGRRRRGLRLLLAGWVVLAVAKTYAFPIVTSGLNHVPGMRLVAFYRYANPTWTLALVLLAAFALQDVLDSELTSTGWVSSAWGGFTVVGVGYGVASGVVHAAGTTAPEIVGWLHLSYGWALSSVAIGLVLLWVGKRRPKAAVAGLGVALALEAVVFFALPSLSAPRSWEADARLVSFVRDQARAARTAEGFGRIYSIGGPLAPNYGSFFGAPQLNVNDVPVPSLWANYVRQELDPKADPQLFLPVDGSPAGFAHRYEALRDHVDAYRNAGVRWIVTQRDEPAPSELHPILHQVLVTDTAIIYQLSGTASYVSTPQGCSTSSTSLDTLLVRCAQPGQLVRRELWMQGWQARVGGVVTPITRRGPFQQIALPAGTSQVSFRFAPRGAGASEGAFLLGLLAVLLGVANLLGVSRRGRRGGRSGTYDTRARVRRALQRKKITPAIAPA